ncbi:SDR family NAD(P)-dependent oxidoreductase [Kitasatospora sp. NPDC057595]|uniref:SDR family NAD(P)-dependent oxidoreductase n=1 Tax=Kitasatospora sp. NPDC057595 TaxID=3346177 RepID=UPI003690410E
MKKSVIITGASSGLGLATTRELAAAGSHVIMACRSVPKGEAAAAEIRAAIPDASLEVVELDLSALSSVRAGAREILAKSDRPPLHVLICNAGIQVVNGVQRSSDGYELTFATNHLGHFLLTQLLVDHIVEPGRVILVSSEVHQGPRKSMGFPAPRWEDPQALVDPDRSVLGDSAKSGRIRYATSKLANLYATYELARRVVPREITVNAFDPGLMPGTSLDRDWPPRIQRVYAQLTPLLVKTLPGARSVEQSSADLAWLATAPEPAGTTGAYFSGRQPRESSKESHDRTRAAELWTASERLVAAHG